MACLETTIVAPVTHEYAPACVWWWLDERGKVAAEVGWFDWSDRSTDPMRSHGTVPPSCGDRHRDPSWYQRVAEEYSTRWSHDPAGSALEMFASGCTFGRVGRVESSGLDELARTRQAFLDQLPLPGRSMQVQRVVGEGSALAMLVTVGDTCNSTRGTVVLTFDSSDLIVSERTYCDWGKAMPQLAPAARQAVGSAEWTLRG
jgi:hypothetical protein